MKDHVRDDENKRYMDLSYPITYCGYHVTDDPDVAYSVPTSAVITEPTAKKRIAKGDTRFLCKRCFRSITT